MKCLTDKDLSSWLKEYRQLKLTERILKIVFNPFQRVLALSHEIALMAYPELTLIKCQAQKSVAHTAACATDFWAWVIYYARLLKCLL